VLEQWAAAHAKAAAADEELKTMAIEINIKLVKNNNDVNQLTKKEIISLLFTCFAVKEDANKNHKCDIVALLSREIEKKSDMMLYSYTKDDLRLK
jgi:hypothetical protein